MGNCGTQLSRALVVVAPTQRLLFDLQIFNIYSYSFDPLTLLIFNRTRFNYGYPIMIDWSFPISRSNLLFAQLDNLLFALIIHSLDLQLL
ncbi:hypothetical protein L6452_38696 [Arctium lappa]|uniref:Uncharacterized protein n=1 Tax=Arctium lappa TaxID=4217 RepID=A0ACB8XR09_ARCLA|nr:hypothetical protein L6452_38696 [Arctium lappa]